MALVYQHVQMGIGMINLQEFANFANQSVQLALIINHALPVQEQSIYSPMIA